MLKSNGQDRESAAHLRRVLALGTNAMAANNLAWLLSTSTHPDVRNGPEAVSFALQACQATGFRYANLVATLAAALAESGKFDEAAAVAMKAHDLALASGDKAFAARYQQLSELYKSGQKYR